MLDDDIQYDGAESSEAARQMRLRMRTTARYWPALVGALFLGGAAGFGTSFAITPTFQSSALFIPPQQQQSGASNALASLGALSGIVTGGGVKNSLDQYVSMMESVTIRDRIILRFGLAKVYETQFKDQTRKRLAQNVQITAGKKDGLIRVDAIDTDPKRAAAIANTYIEELRMMTSRLAITEAQQRRAFFERLLDDTKARLVAAQIAVEGSGFNPGALKAEPKTAADAYATLRANLMAAQVKLEVMHGSLADTAPEVQQQSALVQALGEQVARLESSESSAKGTPDYIGKYRDFKYQETLFDLYSKQYEIARIDESREGALIQVVDEGQPAERKFAPHRSTFALLGGVIGLLLALFMAWRRASAPVVHAE